MTTGWARSRFLETPRSAPSPEAPSEPPQKLGAGREEGAPTARGRRQDAPHTTSSKCGGGAEHAAGFSLLTQGPCHPGAGPPPPPLTRPDAMVTSVLQEARSLLGDRALFPPLETWGRGRSRGRRGKGGLLRREEELSPQGPRKGTGRSGVHWGEGVGPTPSHMRTQLQTRLLPPFCPDHNMTSGT